MSKARLHRHPTFNLSFAERANLPGTPPLAAYLLRLMARKCTNLCLAADVQTTSQLLNLAEECGNSICLLKTHADIISDFGERTIRGLTEIAARKKFLLFEDRKFSDIGSTVEMQYGAGSHQIASWAAIINAHIFPGPAIITSLRSAAYSAVAAYNSTFTTEITGGRYVGPDGQFEYEPTLYSSVEAESSELSSQESSDEDNPPRARTNLMPDGRRASQKSLFNHRKDSIVSISTTISSSTEQTFPSPINIQDLAQLSDEQPPLSRGLLLLAQISSADNLFNSTNTKRCIELAREHKDFVLGFVAQESLNSISSDNFIVMTPGVRLSSVTASKPSGSLFDSRSLSRSKVNPPTGGRQSSQICPTTSKPPASSSRGDGGDQLYDTPRQVILEKGIDVIIVGRGILNADDRGAEAERYRREGWKAMMERCNGKA